MELSHFYPTPHDLIQNELRVLDYLWRNTYIAEEHSDFSRDAKIHYFRYRDLRDGFEFASYLDVSHTQLPTAKRRSIQRRRQPNLRLIVAAIIEQVTASAYGNISYVLAVCRLRSKHPSLLRKFHFDVTATDAITTPRRQQHPMCHLQYCGGMIPLMKSMGLRDEQLRQMHENLSEPRVFFWPMSLALLVDMAFHEFPDPRSESFRASNEWRGIIRENENLLLLPFYERCVEVIRDSGGQSKTLADEFYVG